MKLLRNSSFSYNVSLSKFHELPPTFILINRIFLTYYYLKLIYHAGPSNSQNLASAEAITGCFRIPSIDCSSFSHLNDLANRKTLQWSREAPLSKQNLPRVAKSSMMQNTNLMLVNILITDY